MEFRETQEQTHPGRGGDPPNVRMFHFVLNKTIIKFPSYVNRNWSFYTFFRNYSHPVFRQKKKAGKET